MGDDLNPPRDLFDVEISLLYILYVYMWACRGFLNISVVDIEIHFNRPRLFRSYLHSIWPDMWQKPIQPLFFQSIAVPREIN